MKILLTAPPGTGKSTVLEAFLNRFPKKCIGILARELRGDNGKRIGFTSINSSGASKQFMFDAGSHSERHVGSYRVDVQAIESFVIPELTIALATGEGLVYIDEIGRAQARSEAFLSTLRELFFSDADVLATIVYEDEPWSIEFKHDPGVCILSVTRENRDDLPDLLCRAFLKANQFGALDEMQQNTCIEMLQDYVKDNKMISARKLFDNAIEYVLDNRVEKISGGTISRYIVTGKTRTHQISKNENGRYRCDCDLANGMGIYTGKQQTCSHEMSVRLIEGTGGELDIE